MSIPRGSSTVSTVSLGDNGFLSVGAAAACLGLVGQSVGMHSVVSHFTLVGGGFVQDACGFGGYTESRKSLVIFVIHIVQHLYPHCTASVSTLYSICIHIVQYLYAFQRGIQVKNRIMFI